MRPLLRVLFCVMVTAAIAAASPGLKARASIAQFQAIERSLPPLPSGSGTIVGVVITDTGEPAVGATVSLKQPEEPPDFEPPAYRARTTITDALGRFTFSGVPANTVELSATMPGFLEAVYGQARPGLRGTPIRLHADEQLPVELRLSRGSIIAGAVLDAAGAPAAGISVYAFRMRPSSDAESMMGSGGEATTDQRGEYRIADLPPGKTFDVRSGG